MTKHSGVSVESDSASQLRIIAALALGASLACRGAACLPPVPPPRLRPTAAYVLDCPEGKVTTRQIDEKTSVAQGCGRQATFVLKCLTDIALREYNCQWHRDSDVSETPPPQDW